MNIIDLRSDTVTQPTSEMRKAMAEAEVGDDVFEEDPTINRLQQLAARRMGKEAGLLVPSGTMGNLVAVLTHCGRGDEVILGDLAHTFLFEGGGIAAYGGVNPHTLPNQPDGTLEISAIRQAVRSDDVHFPVTKLIVLENTHNRCGGVPLTAAYTRSVGDLAHSLGLSLHMDGARIFNASVALNVEAAELAAAADSITFCLSKGLCAPVGSVLCGTGDYIRRARRIRKHLGGGMRQAGVLAAAGLVALEGMVDRLAEDHARAHRLAGELRKNPALSLDPGSPFTNMIFANLADSVRFSAKEIAAALAKDGIRVGVVGERRFRLVVHYWIDDLAVERVLQAFWSALKP